MATNFSDIRKLSLGKCGSYNSILDHFRIFTLDLGLEGTMSFSSEKDCDIRHNTQIIGAKNCAYQRNWAVSAKYRP